MDKPTAIERMKNTAQIHNQIAEVVNGKRGFISYTAKKAASTGVPVESVTKWATDAGLTSKNHGRYGLCFSL
jgi:hypothetical protein